MSIDKNFERYKIAIDARHKLNDDYHKWMTFYYVANGAILVSLTALYQKNCDDFSLLALSFLGIGISIFWNFSCKGYYYWSLNWIKLIKKFEKECFGEDQMVYGFFSKLVADNEKSILCPLEPKNISTPKLTMLFSYVSIICWTFYAVHLYEKVYYKIILVCCVILIYYFLPKFVVSRKEGQHEKI